MTETDGAGGYDAGPDDIELEDDGVLDASDTLDGDPGDDPLDQAIVTADRWSAGEGYGTTLAEERAGEPLDRLLAEEEPDIDPYGDDGGGEAEGGGDGGGEAEGGGDGGDLAQPRAGRLVAEDEGAHADEEPDLVARDAGIDGGAASAEEAAVHVDADGS